MDSSAGMRYKDEEPTEGNPQYVIYLPNYPDTEGAPSLTLLGPYDNKDEAAKALEGMAWRGELIELWPPDSE